MATTTTKPDLEMTDPLSGMSGPDWRKSPDPGAFAACGTPDVVQKPSQMDALQALLAFSALHEQVRRRKALAARHKGFDSRTTVAEFEPDEIFVLDEVLQLVAERAIAITGADGL